MELALWKRSGSPMIGSCDVVALAPPEPRQGHLPCPKVHKKTGRPRQCSFQRKFNGIFRCFVSYLWKSFRGTKKSFTHRTRQNLTRALKDKTKKENHPKILEKKTKKTPRKFKRTKEKSLVCLVKHPYFLKSLESMLFLFLFVSFGFLVFSRLFGFVGFLHIFCVCEWLFATPHTHSVIKESFIR